MMRKIFMLIFYMLLSLLSVLKAEQHDTIVLKADWSFSSQPNNSELESFSNALDLSCEYKWSNNCYANLNVGISILDLKRDGFGSFSNTGISNILIGGGYIIKDKPADISHAIGLSAGVPLALFGSDNLDDKRLREFNYNSAISAQGWRNPYLRLINTCPVIVNYESKLNLGNQFDLNIKLSPAYLIAVNSRPSGVALLSSCGLKFSYENYSVACCYNNFATTQNLENNDHSQSSLFLDNSFKQDKLLYDVKLNVNLDAPNGILYNPPKTKMGITCGAAYIF